MSEWRAETADGADLSLSEAKPRNRAEARQFANIRADERGTTVTRVYWYTSPKRNPMTTKRKTTKNPILTKSRALLDLKNAYFNLYSAHASPHSAEHKRLTNAVATAIRKANMAGASGVETKNASDAAWAKYLGKRNPRAHIPAIRGRGRPAKKRRKTVLTWTDRKGNKHSLEFKGHSVESMKQLATSMVAYGETSEVIVDY